MLKNCTKNTTFVTKVIKIHFYDNLTWFISSSFSFWKRTDCFKWLTRVRKKRFNNLWTQTLSLICFLNVSLQLFQYWFQICPLCNDMYCYIGLLISVSFYLECNVHIIYLLQSVMIIHTVWSVTIVVVNVVLV